jgi:serpin B
MGMDIAFRPGADFSRMSSDGPFCIDFVRQKTFIDVDERGTRAAAATVVGVRRISFNGIIVDRPFVFAIRERLSGTILFVGIVGDPTLEDSGDDRYTRTCG